jgi:hypothetical protein
MDEVTHFWPLIQTLLTGITLLVSGLVAFIVKGALQSMRDLRSDHEALRKDIHDSMSSMKDNVSTVREMIAGEFIKRAEALSAIAKLELETTTRIDRLDGRVFAVERVCVRSTNQGN